MVDQMVKLVTAAGRPTGGSGRTIGGLRATFEQLLRGETQLALLPYGVPRGKGFAASTGTTPEVGVADRFDLPSKVRDFDARPFLSDRVLAAFTDPSSCLRDDILDADLPRGGGTTTDEELLKLAARWEGINRVLVVPATAVDSRDQAGVFGVLKKEGETAIRQIINRKTRNAREYPLKGRSLAMPHAVLLCLLPLERKYCARASLDDLSNYFHAFAVTDQKAKSNVIGGVFRAGQVAQYCASARSFPPPLPVRLCFRGLSMGDLSDLASRMGIFSVID